MGTGAFNNGTFDFVIVAPDAWADNLEKAEWQARFIEASRALHEATEGQMRFGRIFMADEGWGLGHAEYVLHGFPGTAYATSGGYGQLGRAIQLFSQQRTGDPRTIVHEFGHHAFRLGDEYTGPVQQDAIDTEGELPANPPADPSQDFSPAVPLLPSENDSQSLQFGYAILRFGNNIQRRVVQDHTPTQITVFNGFTQDPRTADEGVIFYQPQYNAESGFSIRCSGAGDADFCIMDRFNDEQGGTQDVREFCWQDNHDPNHDTSHDAQHGGLSCWEVIQDVMEERYGFPLEVPNPAVVGQETNTFPVFHDLAKEARIALVLDRSGSMGEDNKIQGARFGVEQWLTGVREVGDFLSVIWFNQDVETKLPLTQFDDQSQLDDVIGEVNAVNPGGWTNIRDALYEAADQILPPDESELNRAAVQAIVLLTDGIHNRPEETTIDEVIPTLQDRGIPVYVVALGTPENVDYEALEELALETGGFFSPVGLIVDTEGNPIPPDQQNAFIAIQFYAINNVLRNGLIQVDDETVAGAPPDSTFGKAVAEAKGKRLTLEDLAKLQRLEDAGDFVKRRRHPQAFTVPFLVEEGASSATFAITYERKQKFHLYLINPEGDSVDFASSSEATLIAPESPYATAILKKPKPGLWHALVARASAGAATRVNYAAGVENRMIVATADCDREVDVGAPVSICASGTWKDPLSGLHVTARLTGPDGSIHNVVLSDATGEEPSSGDYRGVFTPERHGRYTGEVRIVSKGKARKAGSIHRAVHAPQNGRKAAQYDMGSKAPVFVRRVPIYFDAGRRPDPKDRDEARHEPGTRAPVRERKESLKPLNIDHALKLVRRTKAKRPAKAEQHVKAEQKG